MPLRLASIVLALPIVLHCCCVEQGAEGDLETPDAGPHWRLLGVRTRLKVPPQLLHLHPNGPGAAVCSETDMSFYYIF